MRRAIVVAITVLNATVIGVMAMQAEPQKITVTSSVLKEGQPMPKDYTADGKNVSPPISWSNLPAGTKELALICEDPVAPTPQPFVHWVLYKIPPTATGLPEGLPIDAATPMPKELTGTIQGISRIPASDLARTCSAQARCRPQVPLHRLRAGYRARRPTGTQQDAAARSDEGAHHRSRAACRDVRTNSATTGVTNCAHTPRLAEAGWMGECRLGNETPRGG